MLSVSLLALTLCGDILVQPFRLTDAEPDHHQVHVRAAMASDGRFAVAWLDSLRIDSLPFCELEFFVRFFERDGNPLTDPYKITKAVDTNWICDTHLDMDSAGNTVLVWTEIFSWSIDEDLLRLQLFDQSGDPLGPPQTDHQGQMDDYNRAVGVSLNDQGEFAIAWCAREEIYARRYSFASGPQGNAFRVHGDLPDDVYLYHPEVALNDAGDLVVTWVESLSPKHIYPRFQAFDAGGESILPWEPLGHRIDDGENEQYHGSRPEVHWLDNDRFVVFWGDFGISSMGRVFSDRGLTRHPIRAISKDTLWRANDPVEGWYSTAVAPNDSFAHTHMRNYSDYPDGELRTWDHGGGILGYIQDNEPIRRTSLFEYTPPWGADTVNSHFNHSPHVQVPAVACSNDRIVWVYSRLNTDTIFEAFAMITDWDMGIGVTEQPPVTPVTHHTDWEVVTSIGPQVVLHYEDRPQGFHAQVFDATGRKVDELHSTEESGMITWGEGYGPGVYFIREESGYRRTLQKVILVQ